MNEPKIISQKSVFKAKLFEVKKLELISENGSKRTHFVVERTPIVSVFPITKSYDIYLVSQYRYLLGRTTLEAVAGHIEKGETSLAAAKRELKEEIGIIGGQWEEIKRIEGSASVFKTLSHLFMVKDLELGDPEPEDGEDTKLVKMSLKEGIGKIMSGEINHSTTIIGILLLDKLRKGNRL